MYFETFLISDVACFGVEIMHIFNVTNNLRNQWELLNRGVQVNRISQCENTPGLRVPPDIMLNQKRYMKLYRSLEAHK